jgi:ABC-2 type transport system permease protein
MTAVDTGVVDRPAPQGIVAQRAERDALLAEMPLLEASPPTTFFRGTGRSLREIWNYRELLGMLFRRELKVRYKDSVLGFFWTLLRPLAQLLVYSIAIGKFLGASRAISDYPVYVFAGLTIWQLISEIIAGGTGSLLANGGLIKKVYLPREVFPLGVVASSLFNFVTQVLILTAATFAFGKPLHPGNLGYAALSLGIVVIWATALAFVLGAINVYLRDVQFLVEIGLMWGLWTAPVVYPLKQVSTVLAAHEWVKTIYLANPITQAVLGFQRAFWTSGGSADTVPNLAEKMGITIGVGLVLLWLAQRVFARLQSNFAQEL